MSIHSINGFFTSFFYYLLSNLEEFLEYIPNPEIFFAGLFDAEGKVSLYNKSFRWACKDENLVKIYSKGLSRLKLFKNYDKSNINCYNLENFYIQIFPHIKNKEKRNLTKLLCKGKGEILTFHKKILKYISNNPNQTAKGITKALKRSKVYSELKFLSDYGFIERKPYPFRFKIKNKGIKNLGD